MACALVVCTLPREQCSAETQNPTDPRIHGHWGLRGLRDPVTTARGPYGMGRARSRIAVHNAGNEGASAWVAYSNARLSSAWLSCRAARSACRGWESGSEIEVMRAPRPRRDTCRRGAGRRRGLGVVGVGLVPTSLACCVPRYVYFLWFMLERKMQRWFSMQQWHSGDHTGVQVSPLRGSVWRRKWVGTACCRLGQG